MKIEEVLSLLRNRRVEIAYDSSYPAISLLFYHILPYFTDQNKIFVIYSDNACRRLREVCKSLSKEAPELVNILKNSKAIKIGQKKCIPFGLHCSEDVSSFIPEDLALDDYAGLTSIAESVTGEDVLVLVGFYIMPMIYGREALRSIYAMFNALPSEITVFSLYSEGFLENSVDKAIKKLHDVVIRIKREDEFFDFGEDIYLVGVDQSIIREIRPGYARYRIGDDGRFVRI